jgi:hypothetical protein
MKKESNPDFLLSLMSGKLLMTKRLGEFPIGMVSPILREASGGKVRPGVIVKILISEVIL